jgi:hypothetical protein
MTKRKSKIVKLVGTSYFRRIRVSSNSNRLVQFNKVPRVRIPLSPGRKRLTRIQMLLEHFLDQRCLPNNPVVAARFPYLTEITPTTTKA